MDKKRLLELAGVELTEHALSHLEGVAAVVSLIRRIHDRDALARIEQVVHEQMDSISSR